MKDHIKMRRVAEAIRTISLYCDRPEQEIIDDLRQSVLDEEQIEYFEEILEHK